MTRRAWIVAKYIYSAIFLIVIVRILIERSLDAVSITLLVLNFLMILFQRWNKGKASFPEGNVLAASSSDKKKILIVDDDKGLIKMIRSTLLVHGYEVITSTTGEKGIVLARNQKPDLIILDVLLPGIKGREVCSRLKDDAHTRDIPVIFLTAKDSPDDVKAEMEVGAISHLTKPINPRILAVEIKKILGV